MADLDSEQTEGAIEYSFRETANGVWREYTYPEGNRFREYKSKMDFRGLPMVHVTIGKCPETGKRIVAKGVIAIGRIAVGVVAIGHLGIGLFAVGQAGLGLFGGLGQLATGCVAIGQAAIGLLFGLGQLATGYVAVGQFAIGYYAMGQMGAGIHVWSTTVRDVKAYEFFKWLLHLS